MVTIATDRLSKLTNDLERAVDLTKKIFSTAPDMIPAKLEAFVFLPKEKINDELLKVLSATPDEMQDAICSIIEHTVADFERTIAHMEASIAARQQPTDLPRRGPRPFKQFKPRRGEW